MKNSILFFSFLFCSLLTVGQSLDALLKKLPSAKEDTAKINLLFNIQKKYLPLDPDSALYYNSQCEHLIDKLSAVEFRHRCFHEFVKIYHAKKDYKNALAYCLSAIKIARTDKNKFQEATSCRAIFNIYHNLQLNDSAVKYAVYSLNLTKEIGDTSNIATNFGNLCWLYMDLNQYGKAEQYGLEGVKAGKHYADTIGLLISINNLALCYLRTNKNEKAVELFEEQLMIGKMINRERSIRNAYTNLSSIYFHTGDAKSLSKTAASLIDFNKSEGEIDNQNQCLEYVTKGYSFILQKDFKLAEAELLKGLKIAENDSLNSETLDIYVTLSKVKFAQHDFSASNFYESKWDSLTAANNEKELSEYSLELETKYETEKKSNTIMLQQSQLREKSFFNYLLAGAGIGILIISLLGYRTYRQKQKLQQQRINELETQQQLTATEAVLKGEEQERARIAKDLHDGLGGMLSGIKYSFNTMKGNMILTPENAQAFERSMDMLDSSIKEMRRVAHNMMPEALVKFGLDTALKDFCNDINQSGALQVSYRSIGLENAEPEQTVSITIYRIVQELINNTMKHAAAKSAVVQVTRTNEHLSVTVEDDGQGFDTSILKQRRGIGWDNIRNRVEFLKGVIDIQSQKEKGTSVHIELNI